MVTLAGVALYCNTDKALCNKCQTDLQLQSQVFHLIMIIIAVINVKTKWPDKHYNHDDHFGSYCKILCNNCQTNLHLQSQVSIVIIS